MPDRFGEPTLAERGANPWTSTLAEAHRALVDCFVEGRRAEGLAVSGEIRAAVAAAYAMFLVTPRAGRELEQEARNVFLDRAAEMAGGAFVPRTVTMEGQV